MPGSQTEMKIPDCQKQGKEDDHTALDKLVEMINLLMPMERSEDREE